MMTTPAVSKGSIDPSIAFFFYTKKKEYKRYFPAVPRKLERRTIELFRGPKVMVIDLKYHTRYKNECVKITGPWLTDHLLQRLDSPEDSKTRRLCQRLCS